MWSGICHPRSDSPNFVATFFDLVPWDEEAPPTKLLLHDAPKVNFYHPDHWHCLLLGVAKTFCASAVLCILPHMPGSNKNDRYAHLTSIYSTFCAEAGEIKYFKDLKETMFENPGSWPEGHWSKGSFTATMMKFVEKAVSPFADKSETLRLIDAWWP